MLKELKISTAQTMKFSIKDFFSECDQIRGFLRIWSHWLKKSLMENFIACAVQLEKRRLPTLNPACTSHKLIIHAICICKNAGNFVVEIIYTNNSRTYDTHFSHKYSIILVCYSVMSCFDFDGNDLLDTSCNHRHLLELLLFSRVNDANTSLIFC